MSIRIPKSKIGLTVASIYVLLAIVLIIYSFNCHFDVGYPFTCEIALRLYSVTPWGYLIALLAFYPNLSNNLSLFWLLITLTFLVNTVVAYWLGKGIQRLFTKNNQ
mgnify:CR=1 FL=1